MTLKAGSRPPTRAGGYSGTPLAQKLGLKPAARLCTIGAPPDYLQWLGSLPPDATVDAETRGNACDIVHVFVGLLGELVRELPKCRRMISPNGAIWVSWLKKSSGISTDVSEDAIRALALRTDLVDVKVCAVTEIWSGLKLVVRKHLR